MLSVDIAETAFEARVGGNIVDRGVDGSECRWARILASAKAPATDMATL